MRLISDFLFLILFFMLIGVWLVMWIGFHLVGGAIHLLLVIAAIALVVHLFRGRRPA
jgi:hypothetical protein